MASTMWIVEAADGREITESHGETAAEARAHALEDARLRNPAEPAERWLSAPCSMYDRDRQLWVPGDT